MKLIYLNHIKTYIITHWGLNCIILTILHFDTILIVQIPSIYIDNTLRIKMYIKMAQNKTRH